MSKLSESPYLIELLTPKQTNDDFEARLEVFAERYRRILAAGAVVSIPDNPLGNLHFTAPEVVDFLDLPVDPERTLLHLNSFHRKTDLNAFLDWSAGKGLKNLLVVSGDGGPRLPRLEPADIGIEAKTVTAVELLRYIEGEFPGVFACGVAFNQFDPPEHELDRLERKIEAGARFVITQPVIGRDPTVAALADYQLPVFAGAWMSPRLELLGECVGREATAQNAYDPVENLAELHRAYPRFGLYLALLSFKRDWSDLLIRQGQVASAR